MRSPDREIKITTFSFEVTMAGIIDDQITNRPTLLLAFLTPTIDEDLA